MIGQGLPSILAAYASMKRIQTFLAMDEKRDITADDLDERLAEKAENMGLSIENASFSWLPDSPVVLEDIDVTLQPGKLHMVVGPVAAGKTSLLVSMLGESTLVKGKINCPKGRMAYASQDVRPSFGLNRHALTCIFLRRRSSLSAHVARISHSADRSTKSTTTPSSRLARSPLTSIACRSVIRRSWATRVCR